METFHLYVNKLTLNESIEGITLPIKPERKTFKLSQYADDFGRVSGLKLNIKKTEVYWIKLGK